jgi:PKD repeat protein
VDKKSVSLLLAGAGLWLISRKAWAQPTPPEGVEPPPPVVPPKEQFTLQVYATPRTGDAPLTVGFELAWSGAMSTSNIHWDFGDGSSSIYQNPSHTFEKAGSYLVRVTADSRTGGTAMGVITINVTGNGFIGLPVISPEREKEILEYVSRVSVPVGSTIIGETTGTTKAGEQVTIPVYIPPDVPAEVAPYIGTPEWKQFGCYKHDAEGKLYFSSGCV